MTKAGEPPHHALPRKDPHSPGPQPPMPGACKFCRGGKQYAFTTADYNRRCSPARFRYLRCSSCGTYELDNVPTDLDAYYPADYYVFPKNLAEADRSVAGEEYKLAMVRRHVAGGRLLEIGPGAGMFAHLSARSGFRVETIEVSARSANFIQTVLGITTHHAADEVAALAACGPFDVIAMWHVIEHVRDPVSLLNIAAERISPGGILVIATPNPGSLQFNLLRARWAHLDAPRHLFLIPADVLRGRAARLGLQEVLFTTSDEGAAYWNRFGWRVSLQNGFPVRGAAWLAAAVGRVIAALLWPVEASGRLGSTYTMILRKP